MTNEMKNKKYTSGTVRKSNTKIADTEAKSIPLYILDLSPSFLAWYRHFNKKWRGQTSFT
jgi:hypothetical protein